MLLKYKILFNPYEKTSRGGVRRAQGVVRKSAARRPIRRRAPNWGVREKHRVDAPKKKWGAPKKEGPKGLSGEKTNAP